LYFFLHVSVYVHVDTRVHSYAVNLSKTSQIYVYLILPSL
jgi:hypothetical protein